MSSFQGFIALVLLFVLCVSVSEAYDCSGDKIKELLRAKPYNCYNDNVRRFTSCNTFCFSIINKDHSEKFFCPWGDRKASSSCKMIKTADCDTTCKKDPGSDVKLKEKQAECCGTCIAKCGEVYKPAVNENFETTRKQLQD